MAGCVFNIKAFGHEASSLTSKVDGRKFFQQSINFIERLIFILIKSKPLSEFLPLKNGAKRSNLTNFFYILTR